MLNTAALAFLDIFSCKIFFGTTILLVWIMIHSNDKDFYCEGSIFLDPICTF